MTEPVVFCEVREVRQGKSEKDLDDFTITARWVRENPDATEAERDNEIDRAIAEKILVATYKISSFLAQRYSQGELIFASVGDVPWQLRKDTAMLAYCYLAIDRLGSVGEDFLASFFTEINRIERYYAAAGKQDGPVIQGLKRTVELQRTPSQSGVVVTTKDASDPYKAWDEPKKNYF